jgi:hypothetical protein
VNHILGLEGHKGILGDSKIGFSHNFHPHQSTSLPKNDQGVFSFVCLIFYLDVFAFICVYFLHKTLKNLHKKIKELKVGLD